MTVSTNDLEKGEEEKPLKEEESMDDPVLEAPQDTTEEQPSEEKRVSHVKDYETGVSFSVHDNPLIEKAGIQQRRRSSVEPVPIPARHRLIAEKDSLNWSMFALRMAVLATACGQTVLQPNFPFLVIPGQTDESFENTDPFNFSAATYFLPMTTLFGTAITSAFVGTLSDRIGRRPCILLCMGFMTFTLIGQYFAQNTFWGFCAASFVNGLFCSGLPVAMAYASDVHPSRAKKDEEIGMLVGANMLGMSGGGVVSILMENQNKFAPLLVASGIDFVAFVLCLLFLLEPDKTLHFDEEHDGEDEDEEGPEKIDWKIFTNVMVGALLDNIGSSGLFPLTLAPLAFNNFLLDFEIAGEEPIMSANAYKWLSVCVALMVIPGAALTQPVFARIGAAGGCVFGNFITAIGIIACMLIAEISPPSNASFTGFIVCLYLVFPLTVISQLSTGPMLDMIAPVSQRGFAQGANMTIMNFAFAVSPWFLGVMSDNIGTNQTLWFCVGISLLASLVNTPLMFAPALKRKPPIDYQKAMGLEDQELVDRALRGEWVPAKFIDDLNFARFHQGLPFLQIPVKPYDEEKESLKVLRRHAKDDFEYHRITMHSVLAELDDPEKKQENVALMNKILPPKEEQERNADAMGKWFAEYMKDSGYFLDGGWPPVQKQLIMQAFPPINSDGEINEDNIERTMVNYLANVNRFLREEASSRATKGFANSVLV